ncbi:Psf2-domain-containing protein [Spinellus fusiger]|nr:Psf2-domain-containing protein [Spinellus fusiger]
MALSRAHQLALTPQEVEFLCGSEMITIIPVQRIPEIELIQQSVGPFRPPLQIKVPLWLAILMKKQQKCTMVCPEWLTVERLKVRLEEEEQHAEFSKLPFHYMEMAQLLLESAREDIPNAEQVRTLLKDLRETRQAKSRVGLSELDDTWLGMNSLSLMEINEIRPFFTHAYDQMRRLNAEDSERRAPRPL